MSRTEFKEMMNFYGRVLLGRRLAKKISIEVVFVDNKTKIGTVPASGGLAEMIPLDYDIRSRNHREFGMHFNDSLSYKEMMIIAAHEMAHVRQFAKGELTETSISRIFRWNGMKYKLTKETYPFVPWEKDARCSEYWLFKFYQQYRINEAKASGSYVQWA